MPEDGRRLQLTPVVRAVLEDPGSPRLGAAAPEVTVVVFTDYRCGVCRATDPALARLLARDPGVQVVFKDWPIRGDASRDAARAALAPPRQGRYLALHRALMAAPPGLAPAELQRAARVAGLDGRRLH